MIPKSGGDYAYILAALGPLPAFLFLWVALLIIIPTGNAVLGLTFAYYILQPLWSGCEPPDLVVRLLSAVVIGTYPESLTILLNYLSNAIYKSELLMLT